MAIESLNDLFVEQLRDLYDAENQLIKALPKMAEGANSDELRQGFEPVRGAQLLARPGLGHRLPG